MLILALIELGFLNVYYGFIYPTYRYQFSHEDIICYIIHGYNLTLCIFIFPIMKLFGAQLKSLLLNKTGYERHRSPINKSKKESLLNDETTITTSEVPH
jgi:hypothetical protein